MERMISPGRTVLWLSLIVLLGLGIRLAGLFWGEGYCSIGPSDAMEAYQFAVDYTHGEPRAQYLAQPNYNNHAKLPGPFWTLFCVAGMRLLGSPEGVVLELILVNTAAIVLIYLLAARTLGPPAALWAALLAATLPFPIYYSVSIYNPNVMTFLGAALFLALWTVIRRERARAVFWLPFLVLFMPQFHMCVTMLLPAVALVLLLARPRVNWPWLLGGLLAGLLLYVPYVNGDLHHGWQNTLGMTQNRSGYSWGGLKALTAPLSLLTNWVPQWSFSFAEYRQLGRACFGWFGLFLAVNLLSAIIGLLLVGRIVLDVRNALLPSKAEGGFRLSALLRPSALGPRPSESAVLFLALLLCVPLFLAAVSGKNFRTHYSLVVLPALLTLAGGAVVKWLAAPRVGRTFKAALVLLVCANVWFMPAMFHDLHVRLTRGPAFVGSFRHLESVYQCLKQHAGAQGNVEVDDQAYFRRFTHAQREHLDAQFIRRYVIIREKECAPRSGETATSVRYQLCRAEEVQPDDSAVAYRAHGIALKRVTP
jgi:hypothetical protein